MTGQETNLRAAYQFPAGSEGMAADVEADQVRQYPRDEHFSNTIHYLA